MIERSISSPFDAFHEWFPYSGKIGLIVRHYRQFAKPSENAGEWERNLRFQPYHSNKRVFPAASPSPSSSRKWSSSFIAPRSSRKYHLVPSCNGIESLNHEFLYHQLYQIISTIDWCNKICISVTWNWEMYICEISGKEKKNYLFR